MPRDGALVRFRPTSAHAVDRVRAGRPARALQCGEALGAARPAEKLTDLLQMLADCQRRAPPAPMTGSARERLALTYVDLASAVLRRPRAHRYGSGRTGAQGGGRDASGQSVPRHGTLLPRLSPGGNRLALSPAFFDAALRLSLAGLPCRRRCSSTRRDRRLDSCAASARWDSPTRQPRHSTAWTGSRVGLLRHRRNAASVNLPKYFHWHPGTKTIATPAMIGRRETRCAFPRCVAH